MFDEIFLTDACLVTN